MIYCPNEAALKPKTGSLNRKRLSVIKYIFLLIFRFIFKANINRIHSPQTAFKVKGNDIAFGNIGQRIITYMEKILLCTIKVFDKTIPFRLVKIVNPSSQYGRCFLGVEMRISSCLISSLLGFNSGGVDVITPFSST